MHHPLLGDVNVGRRRVQLLNKISTEKFSRMLMFKRHVIWTREPAGIRAPTLEVTRASQCYWVARLSSVKHQHQPEQITGMWLYRTILRGQRLIVQVSMQQDGAF